MTPPPPLPGSEVSIDRNLSSKKIDDRIAAATPPPPPAALPQPPAQTMDTVYTHHPITTPSSPHRPQQHQMYKDTPLYPTQSFAHPHHRGAYHLDSTTTLAGIIPEPMYYQAATATTMTNPSFVAAVPFGIYPQDMEVDGWLQGNYMQDMSQWVSPGAFCWVGIPSPRYLLSGVSFANLNLRR